VSGDEAIPAATVIVLRDRGGGVETLLLRRNSRLGFAAGMWVFPGGRVDPADMGDDTDADEVLTARRAAAREAREEAGIELSADALVPFAHWTPDIDSRHRRFATWFFVAEAPASSVVIDGGEIVDHVWATAHDALALHSSGEVELLPPTFVTLFELAAHGSVADVLEAARQRDLPRFFTRMVHVDGLATVALWEGDAGYDARDPSIDGAQHRLLMGSLPWRYLKR
jgi:8-oxo-dGTP pyrophosphatase MutT (NUDIX family)